MERVMCAMVWEKPGRADDLATLVDELLEIASEHGARSVSRWLRDDVLADADPAEMHVLAWPEQVNFEGWRRDERVRALGGRAGELVASWQTVWVHAA